MPMLCQGKKMGLYVSVILFLFKWMKQKELQKSHVSSFNLFVHFLRFVDAVEDGLDCCNVVNHQLLSIRAILSSLMDGLLFLEWVSPTILVID